VKPDNQFLLHAPTAALHSVPIHAPNAHSTTMIYLKEPTTVTIAGSVELEGEKITFIARPADHAMQQIYGIITCA
jgi:hypothetical protein